MVKYEADVVKVDILDDETQEVIKKEDQWRLKIDGEEVLSLTKVGNTNSMNLIVADKYIDYITEYSVTVPKLYEGGLIDLNKWDFSVGGNSACLKDQEGKTIFNIVIREGLQKENPTKELIVIQSILEGRAFSQVLKAPL